MQTPEVYTYHSSPTSSFQQPSNTDQLTSQPIRPIYNPLISKQTKPLNKYGESQVNRVYSHYFNYNKVSEASVSTPVTTYAYTNNHTLPLNQPIIQNEEGADEIPINKNQV
jgi:hypothetical protein